MVSLIICVLLCTVIGCFYRLLKLIRVFKYTLGGCFVLFFGTGFLFVVLAIQDLSADLGWP